MSLGARWRCWSVFGAGMLLILAPMRLRAQAPIVWQPGWFSCAVLDERRTVLLRTDVAGTTRDETVGRTGRLVLQAGASTADGRFPLEAWYDEVALSRRSVDGDLRPDTDALLGGRFIGTLSPEGRWSPEQRPFVPDRVRDVSDVGATLDDLLPPLPGFLLREGGRMTDTSGVKFERLADSTAAGERLLRLLVQSSWSLPLAVAVGEGGPDAKETGTREVRMVLSPERGLLRLERQTMTEAAMPKSTAVRGAVRASFDERLLLVRRFDLQVEDCPP